MDKAQELQSIARTVQAGLVQLGVCYEVKRLGAAVPVSFRRLLLEGDEWGVLEVDLENLPRGVTTNKLTRPTTIHHLGSVVGRPFYHLNTSGVTYCVDLRSPQLRRKVAQLPDAATFDPAACPQPGYLGLGVTRQGDLWVHPEQLKNVLMAGSQGTGKSALLRLLAYQMVRSGWRLALADPDQTTFNADLWRGAACLVGGQVASDASEASALLNLVLVELEKRAKLFGSAPGWPDSLAEYNRLAEAPLPRLALIVDECNTYFAHKELVEQAADISRRARKWGLHTTFAGHNWRAADIPRGLSAMLQNRLAFRVNDDTSGKVVLERRGMAESLPDTPGRCWVRLRGRYVLMQAYFLDKARLVELVEQMPKSAPADLASDRGQDAGDVDDETALIRRLHAEGMSGRKIQMEVFGYTGGAAFTAVSEALSDTTTTQTGAPGAMG